MAGSGEVVNYNIRPCKNIERKMMCEMISCLATVDELSEYRYIGMGLNILLILFKCIKSLV